MVVHFDLILAKKTPPRRAALEIIWESHRHGSLFYRCSRSKLLDSCFEKIHGGVLF